MATTYVFRTEKTGGSLARLVSQVQCRSPHFATDTDRKPSFIDAVQRFMDGPVIGPSGIRYQRVPGYCRNGLEKWSMVEHAQGLALQPRR